MDLRHNSLKILVSLFILIQQASALGQTVDAGELNDTLAHDIKDLIVVGKSKSQKLREGSYSINVIDVKSIANSLATLNSLINKTSGVKLRQEGGMGSDYDVSINGLSGNSVRYFIDGVPLAVKGGDVGFNNLPIDLIDRIEIYKGVVPPQFGTDALGGAVNIITKKIRTDFIEASAGVGSFHSYTFDANGQYTIPGTKLFFHPTFTRKYSKNDYMMKGVEIWDAESRDYIPVNRRRFHDRYESNLGQLQIGLRDLSWADEISLTGSFSNTEKQLQTGSMQTKVYGDAERHSHAWSIGLNYNKVFNKVSAQVSASHTWDISETVDTVFRIYSWDGTWTPSSRNELTGKGKSIRHYQRPLTVINSTLNYVVNPTHELGFTYLLNRTGNKRTDLYDKNFEPSNDEVIKHVLSLSYNQHFFDARLQNTFFIKDYINGMTIRQTDDAYNTGYYDIDRNSVKNYLGGGVAIVFKSLDLFSVKASWEHSVRLPLSRELLGNGTTVNPNFALRPENSENFNLGFFGSWNIDLDNTLYYEIGGYIRNVKDYVQLSVIEQDALYKYINIPGVFIKGFDAEVRYSWKNALNVMANITFSDARDNNPLTDDGKASPTYKNRLPNRPWVYSNAEVSYNFRNLFSKGDKLNVNYGFQWVHWYFLHWEAFGNKNSKARIPTQINNNIVIAYTFPDKRYNLSVSVDNLFDRKLYDNYMLQKPGRSVFCKFSVFFN